MDTPAKPECEKLPEIPRRKNIAFSAVHRVSMFMGVMALGATLYSAGMNSWKAGSVQMPDYEKIGEVVANKWSLIAAAGAAALGVAEAVDNHEEVAYFTKKHAQAKAKAEQAELKR